MKRVHYYSGLFLSIFIGLHLINHLSVLFGADVHLKIMEILRLFYRNPVVETLILASALMQIWSGISLVAKKQKEERSGWNHLHILSGFYLSFFLFVHIGAVLGFRYGGGIDTNLYFGAMGYNVSPATYFFIPYYSLSVIALFMHIACIHRIKMSERVSETKAAFQAKLLIVTGCIVAFLLLTGMTDYFRGLQFPESQSRIIEHEERRSGRLLQTSLKFLFC